ncbi:MAG: sodium:proton antiporter, partial [Bacteroidota bacterium]
KILEPIYNEALDSGLFPGEYLFNFVSLAIGIILFEGGLTLKRREISGVGPVILKLITFGSLVTFIGGGIAAQLLLDLNWPIAFLFSALIIVTGPTVIAPILQNIPLTRNVTTVLKWEGILIDPVGALSAVLVFEFILSAEGGAAFTSHAFLTFTKVVLIGLALGTLAALALYQMLKREWIPHYLQNVFTLAAVLAVFVFSDLLSHESGLLTVVVMGMVLGNLEVPGLKDILHFKEAISVLLISMLFILLAANIDLDELELIYTDWRPFALFAVVVFVLRPLGVWLSTQGSELNTREKLFVSWVGPRGIVAAGIASLFGIRLASDGVPGAEYITPLVFLIVLGTVLINATTARAVAKWLGVTKDRSDGILILGANPLALVIGLYLKQQGRNLVMIDSNFGAVQQARSQGLEAYQINISNDDLSDKIELIDMGVMLALTASAEVNQYAIQRYRSILGEEGSFRLLQDDELTIPPAELPQDAILASQGDFLLLSDIVRQFPQVHEVPVSDASELEQLLQKMEITTRRIPLFLKRKNGVLDVVPPVVEDFTVGEGVALVYLGKRLD